MTAPIKNTAPMLSATIRYARKKCPITANDRLMMSGDVSHPVYGVLSILFVEDKK